MEHVSISERQNIALQGQTFVVSVNEKGRMTLPVKIRQMLHMPSEPGMVQISVQPDGHIAIHGRLPTVAETAGAVPPLSPSKDWKEVEAIIRDEVAERYRDTSGQ